MSLLFSNSDKQRGFSLLEILVAFSILALSLGVLFQIYSLGSGATALSRDYSKALIVAQSQFAALNQEEKIELGETTGESSDGIKWRRRVFAYENNSGTDTSFRKNHELVNVEIEVDWQTLGRPHEFSLKSLRLKGIK